jgi:hypothetical protein
MKVTGRIEEWKLIIAVTPPRVTEPKQQCKEVERWMDDRRQVAVTKQSHGVGLSAQQRLREFQDLRVAI